MSRKRRLPDLPFHAVKLLLPLRGYIDSLITELIFPFTQGFTLKSLYDAVREIRLAHRGVRPYNDIDEPGTFIVHGTKVQCLKGVSRSLLVIMEVHTGWLYCRLLPQIRVGEIQKGLRTIFAETEIGEAKLSKRQLILLTFHHDVARKLVASVIRVPPGELQDKIRDALDPWHRCLKFRNEIIASPRTYEPIQLPMEEESLPLLNERIREFLHQYNYGPREVFPRRKKLPLCPADRLHEVLTKKQVAAKKKMPERPEPKSAGGRTVR